MNGANAAMNELIGAEWDNAGSVKKFDEEKELNESNDGATAITSASFTSLRSSLRSVRCARSIPLLSI